MASPQTRGTSWPAFEGGHCSMPNPLGRGATQNLTRIGLVLSHQRARRDWLARCVCVVGCLAVGAVGGYFYAGQRLGDVQQQSAASLEQQRQQLAQQLEQSRMTQRVSESRSQELERQIAALVQQLRESQEELTFFRKARDGKH